MLTLIQKIISLVRKKNSSEDNTVLTSLEELTTSPEKEDEVLNQISFQILNEFSLIEYRKQELMLTPEESNYFDDFFEKIEQVLQLKSSKGEKYTNPVDYKLYSATLADIEPQYCHPPTFGNKLNTALLYE
jgi:hypothetical protein